MLYQQYFLLCLLTSFFVLNNSLCPKINHDLDVVSSHGLDMVTDDSKTQQSYALTIFNKWIYKIVIQKKKSISNMIFGLQHLKYLEIDGACFEPCTNKYIPIEIQCFSSSLTQLLISNTRIPYLPDYIGNLTKLKSFALINTGLINLPETISNLIDLETLILTNNYLTSLPQTILKLTKLIRLDLSFNKYLYSIDAINYSPSISYLNIANCRINTLPRNLSSLYYLKMSNNNLTDLTYVSTLGLHSRRLKEFYFDHNQIKFVSLGLFRIQNLNILHLDNNQIHSLPLEAFRNTTLKQLFIRRNCLTSTYLTTLQTNKFNTNVIYNNQRIC